MMQLINKSPYTLSLSARDGDRAVSAFLPTGRAGKIEIAEDNWDALAKHKQIKAWLKKGWLVPVRAKGGAKPAAEPKPPATGSELGSLNARDAVEYVKTIDSVEELHELIEGESRKTVLEAIEARMDELSASAVA